MSRRLFPQMSGTPRKVSHPTFACWAKSKAHTSAVSSSAVSYAVDFVNVSTIGLETSPVASALAGLRANEARYFKNKYDHLFTVEPASKAKKAVEWVHRILKE